MLIGSAMIQGSRQIRTQSTRHAVSLATGVIPIPLSQKWGKSMKKFLRGFCEIFFFNSIDFIYLKTNGEILESRNRAKTV